MHVKPMHVQPVHVQPGRSEEPMPGQSLHDSIGVEGVSQQHLPVLGLLHEPRQQLGLKKKHAEGEK